ncbi:MAG TPA: carboxypeptidase regulatory-like domain-containing protein [Candidatus Dormibacteraeota bacterium]|nr:carboxypeptidase regulatory-like domain-containing protein [Candidatus Dormibacteraeota bacterium]
MTRQWLRGRSIAILVLLLVGRVAAQSDRGAIAGTVLDTSGAAVTGASVTLKGVETGSVYKTVSSSSGAYHVNDLAIGHYDLTVESSGFKTSVQKGVQIQINTVTSLSVTLQPGDVKEQVTVLADAPTVQTDSSDIGTVVEDKQIHDLPLSLGNTGQSFVRSPETFIFLLPGTIGQGTNSDHGSAGVFESKISGGQNFGSEILLDGASVQRSDSGTAFDQTAPSVEALTEFKVTTSTPSAQFGHTSGGVESFTTKSGSNAYHGSIFELFRNEALDAMPWNTDLNNALASYDNAQIAAWNTANPGNTAALEALTKKPRDRQNDFGGALGGPVRIPRLYDGHDKTFFFFAWEQYRNRRGLTNDVLTLPTGAERGGDFSALLGPGLVDSGNNPIINPCTGQQVLHGQIFDPSTTTTIGGQTCRMPFAGNKITSISPVAQKVLGYLPNTNLTGAENSLGVGGTQANFLNPGTLDHVVTTQTSFRIDENLTEKSKLFFSYHSREQSFLNGNNFDLPAPLTPGNYYNYYFTHYLRFGWDYIVSPTVLNHLTIGFNRVYTASKAPSVNGSDWVKTLGIPGASGPTFPQFAFNGAQYGTSLSNWSVNNYSLQVPNALVVADSVSWAKGRHSFRVGFDWRSYQFSLENPGVSSPSYTFSNNETSFAPPSQNPNTSNTGDPFASFLIGMPDQEGLQVSSHYSRWAQNYYAVYVQDDFKARRDLTLNLGLRWDIETPRHEALGAQSVLAPAATNSLSPGQPGALVYGKGATGASTYFKNFGPRIGFAYAPDYLKNTVIRGAYSIYYAPLTYSDFGSALSSGTTANPNFQSPNNFSPVSSLDAGFPSYTPPSNTQDATLNTFTFSGPTYVAKDYGRPGMIQNWDLEIQRQITTDLIWSIGYVGQHGTRLRSNLAQVNTPNPTYNSLGGALQYLVDGSDGHNGPAILSSLGITVPSWFVPGWAPSGNDTIGQLLRPFPQYWSITTNCCLENLGQSTYNALQTKLERRFRNGLNLLASYTYSKTITDADSSFSTLTGFNSNVFGAQNPYNLRGEKAVSYQDIPHAFVVSYLYELPVGPGKRHFNHGVASKALGGWQISGSHRYQSGSPAVINEYATSNPYSGGNYRFSLVPGMAKFGSGAWSTATQVTANGGRVLTGVTPNSNPLLPGTANFSGGWSSSGCNFASGVASAAAPGNPTPVNCGAYLDPSAASISAGGGYVFGNLPPVVSWWRSPGYMNEDFAILKRTSIREGKDILFKLDIPNAFNRHTFGGIDGNPYDSFFGVPGGGGHGVINQQRTLQATLRYEF